LDKIETESYLKMIDWLKFPWLDLFLFIEHYSLADSFLSSFLSATNQIHNTTTKMLKNQNRNDKILKNDICNSCSSKQNWAQFNLIKDSRDSSQFFSIYLKKKDPRLLQNGKRQRLAVKIHRLNWWMILN